MPEILSVDLGSLIVYAVRYTMPRASYVPEAVIAIVRRYLNNIPSSALSVFLRDVERPELASPYCQTAWFRLAEEVRAELLRRDRAAVVVGEDAT